MKYLIAILLIPTIVLSQDFRVRNIKADSVYSTKWGNLPAGGGAFLGWYTNGGSFVTDSLRFIQGANITLTQSGRTLSIAGSASGGGMTGWYVNGQSLVTDTLRFLTPGSMVFTQSGRTIAIYPDTSAGKIATKSDLTAYESKTQMGTDTSNFRTNSNALYLGIHGTADSSKASYYSTTLRIPRLYGWYTNGGSLVTDTLRFLTPTSMVFTQSGSTLSLYPDTSLGKISTFSQVKTDTTSSRTYSNSLYLKNADSTSERTYSNSLYLKNADSTSERTYSNSLYLKNADSTSERTYSNSLYLGIHGTADTATAAYWATGLRVPRLYGWITNGGTLRTDTLRAIAGTYMTLTPSAATLTIAADTTKYATSTASGFLKYADWTTFNNKGASNFRGWDINGGSLITDTLRHVPGTDITLSTSGSALTINADTSKYGTSSASGFLKYSDWTTFNNKGASNFRGWYENGGALQTDTLRLIAGTNMSFSRSGTALTINGPAGAAGFYGWYTNGGALVSDSLRFIQGANITLTQTGRTLTIAGSAGGSTTSVDSIRHTFVDTTARAQASHKVSAIVYVADSSEYQAKTLTKFDTTGIYKTSTGTNYSLTADSSGTIKLGAAIGDRRNGTAFAGTGIWITNAENQVASSTQANVSGHILAFPFVISKTITIDSINYIVSTAGAGACTIAIYKDSSVAGIGVSYPGTRVILGRRDTTSASIKTVSLSATPYQFAPGLYWLAVSSNGTATLRSHPTGAVPNVLGYNPTVAATQEYTCWDVTRTYDQFTPSSFPGSGVLKVAVGPPLIVMRVKSVP